MSAFVDEDGEDIVRQTMRQTAREIFVALYGPALGEAVFADFHNEADRPNSQLAQGVTRAAVSRICCKLRRGLGLSVRVPCNRRAGAAPARPTPAAPRLLFLTPSPRRTLRDMPSGPNDRAVLRTDRLGHFYDADCISVAGKLVPNVLPTNQPGLWFKFDVPVPVRNGASDFLFIEGRWWSSTPGGYVRTRARHVMRSLRLRGFRPAEREFLRLQDQGGVQPIRLKLLKLPGLDSVWSRSATPDAGDGTSIQKLDLAKSA